ncbi:MAG: transpeptidase-transglycosylase, partial [Nitrospiraceae bacterium]
MVGGRDYRTGQFNHAVQARRQAGSLFKPFVYLAAFQRSLESKDNAITPATLLKDAPVTFSHGNTAWSPQNYRQFHGDVTVRTALEQSLNVPAVRVAQTVGVQPIIRLLRDLGIRGPLEDNLSLALGTSEVSLLEITGAFGALAREGRFVPPTGLKTVAEPAQVFSPQAAYLVTSSLKGVVERG